MKFMNKMGKTTLASSIVAASVLSTVNVSYASGSSEQSAQTKQTQNDAIAFGNTKIQKCHLYGWRWYGTFLTLHIAIIKISLVLRK